MNNNKYKVLLVEDDSNITTLVSALLNSGGYQVINAASCSSAIMMYASYNPDLIILDLGLPDTDGTEFIKYVRERAITPIIVLSARTDESEKVYALDIGANDYITKPFGSQELMARVRSTLRDNRHSAENGRYPGGKFTMKELCIDYDKRKIFIANQEVHMTQTEYNIIALLSEHIGRVLTYSTIISEIWGTSDSGSIKKLQVNMANIRKKMGIKPGADKYIVNVLGVGYRFESPAE